MSPRVNDNATTPSANPVVVEAGLQMVAETVSTPRSVIATAPQVSVGKRPLIERRRKRWSRRQW